ncbi:MAG: sigma 54-interacting transcriptional regulator [Acidobacteriota bacterium]|nr:sigma 54-interacting transcriptional regulator [Blastocatellia bacterium]MDW8412019.1 sigma 54-interacting transcriptional regulator [Acidobacteriota bacterium]
MITGRWVMLGSDLSEKLAAGRTALSSGDSERAIALLSEVLVTEQLSHEQEVEVRCQLAELLENTGRYQEALKTISKYELSNTQSQISRAAMAQVWLRLASIYRWLNEPPKAISYANNALRIFSESKSYKYIGVAHALLGYIYWMIDEYAISRDYLLSALEAQRSIDDKRALAQTYWNLSLVDNIEGRREESKNDCLSGLELLRDCQRLDVQDRLILGKLLTNLAFIDIEEGNIHSAVRNYELAIEHWSYVEDKNFLAMAYTNLADALLFTGDWARAESALGSAMRLLRSGQNKRDESAVLSTLGRLYCLQGRFEQAEESLMRGLRLAVESGAKSLEATLWLLLSTVYAAQNQYQEAVQHAEHCLAIETKIGRVIDMAETYSLLGAYYLALLDTTAAKDCLKQGLKLLQSNPNLYHSGLISRLEGKINAYNKDHEAAISALAQSISIFESISYVYEAAVSHYEMGLVLSETAERHRSLGHMEKALKFFSDLRAEPAKKRTVAAIEQIRSSSPSGRLYLPVLTLDALIVERLIAASTSHELLLRELATIIRDELNEQAICFELKKDGLKLITARGADQNDVDRVSEVVKKFLDDGKQLPEGAKIRLLSDKGNESSCRKFLLYTTIDRSANTARIGHFESLLKLVELGLENCTLRKMVRPNGSMPAKAASQRAFGRFITESSAMRKLLERIQKIRSSDVTVLITGESGTGKELVARSIHYNSNRADKPFLPFNCAAVPAELVESRLFGHKRGAFTGADKDNPGIVRAAAGGTLFLDEIGELALDVQPKLLRFLQEKEIHPVGEDRPIRVDVRIVAATNRDLEQSVAEGTFREDLFHRLNVIRLHVPALRERKEDIPLMVEHFLQELAKKANKHVSISQKAMEAMLAYSWPGNVRQLKNELERLVVMAEDGSVILPEHLSPEILRQKTRSGIQLGPQAKLDLSAHTTLAEAVDALERYMIEQSLKRNEWNITRTARELGLTRQGLLLKKRRLGIEGDERE